MAKFSRQCVLARPTTGRTAIKVTWLPEIWAVKGKILKLKENGEWTDGWEVVAVHGRMEDSKLREMQRQQKNHRKHSDI